MDTATGYELQRQKLSAKFSGRKEKWNEFKYKATGIVMAFEAEKFLIGEEFKYFNEGEFNELEEKNQKIYLSEKRKVAAVIQFLMNNLEGKAIDLVMSVSPKQPTRIWKRLIQEYEGTTVSTTIGHVMKCFNGMKLTNANKLGELIGKLDSAWKQIIGNEEDLRRVIDILKVASLISNLGPNGAYDGFVNAMIASGNEERTYEDWCAMALQAREQIASKHQTFKTKRCIMQNINKETANTRLRRTSQNNENVPIAKRRDTNQRIVLPSVQPHGVR